MNAAELRKKSDSELAEHAENLRSEMYDVRFRREVDQVADLNVIKRTRRELARVLTVLSERKLGLAIGGTK
jgi:large subunit ribosomal protein L29